MRIIADTATLFSPEEGAALGLEMVPVGVAIDGQSYKDYIEITPEQFLERIAAGGSPSSSQPALGDLLEKMEAAGEEEVLVLTVGDGLSGGYQTALGARNCLEKPDRVHVVNSGSLAGPLRHMARKAVQMRADGCSVQQILAALEECVRSSVSFVVPADFEFLRRSGRLTAITAKIGGVLKLLPVLTQTEDRTRITPCAIRRSWGGAREVMLQRLEEKKPDRNWKIFVCHGGVPEQGDRMACQVREKFPECETEVLQLSPALMTHGGPGCIVLQAVKL